MANTLKLKRSATPSAVPTTAQLEPGELAVNTADGYLFMEVDGPTIKNLSDHGGLAGLLDDDHTQYLQKATLTTKGDLYVATAASTVVRLPVGGTDGWVLQVDAASAEGVKWAANPAGVTDHGALTGLVPDDDHTQYALLAGRSGGQTLTGGTAAADGLAFIATAGVGAGSEVFTFKGGNNGAATFATLSSTGLDLSHGTYGNLAIGNNTSLSTTQTLVANTSVTTDTSNYGLHATLIGKPASASAVSFTGVYGEVITTGAAFNSTGQLYGVYGLATHSTTTAGISYNSISGGFFGAELGVGQDNTATAMYAVNANCVNSSTNTGTNLALQIGVNAVAQHMRSGTVTDLFGGRFNAATSGGSMVGTVTTATGIRGTVTSGAIGGTITTAVGGNFSVTITSGTVTTAVGLRVNSITGAGTNWCSQFQGGNSYHAGNFYFGDAITPTAKIHLAAGTTAASTAPIKLTSGTSMSAAEVGAIEFTTDDLFFTITTGAARKAFILDDGTRLTSGRVPFATTNGRLTDATGLTFVTDTLTTTKLAVPQYADFTGISTPANPGSGIRRIFVDSGTGKLSVRTNAGTTISLEEQGGGSVARYQETFTGTNGKTITHNLGTQYVTVQVYDSAGIHIECGWTATSTSVVTLNYVGTLTNAIVVVLG